MLALERSEYEHFSLDDPGQHGLTLEEAVRKASELRRKDSSNFYRVEFADENHTTFRVTVVPASSVYSQLMNHVSRLVARYTSRTRAQNE